ncbi:DNA alkylation repair protein [Salinibacterium sp. SWN1162]|uniref:DNA alkylation repair protein n=1 Tax=Salinibacterium sp. SWN1162 TaxID=2792053 RepID=UPI0018CDA9ED|nr:DNA alkylation repair protein [Salinibacterium sp. SWN1162]MBH0009736.1 DNA alkylation repair protein [Salinibacterium sp. SWN1162]
MAKNSDTRAAALVAQLHAEGDPQARADLGRRYGIQTDNAVGLSRARMKTIAAALAPDHELALSLWATGLYEARTIATYIDDPRLVSVDQLDTWCADFDNWAIVDGACFTLFDKAPDAWSRLEPWAGSDREFTKRASFALLWALALHDKDAADSLFSDALPLIEANAHDPRPLVTKAQTMALRAILHQRPQLRPEVDDLVNRLALSTDAPTRRVVRPIVKILHSTGGE